VESKTEKRRELSRVYRELDRAGLIFLAAGNISVRHNGGMLISFAGASAESAIPESFVAARLDGASEAGRPSSEWAMHAAICSAYPAAAAVVHTHSDYCVAVACTGQPLPPFHYMVAAFGGEDVRCAPYVTYGTPELAKAATVALEGRTACLLGNHGMVAYGPSLANAFHAAIRLETLCRQYVKARQAGEVKRLNRAQMDVAIARYATYGRASENG
jgi:L-fuculose-phosphate aldolase